MDAKGRVSFPAKHRKALPDDLLVVIAPDKEFPRLQVWSEEAYGEWIEKLLADKGGYNSSNLEHERFKNGLYERSTPVTTDSAGRILINSELRASVGLGNKAVITGSDDHIEIWDVAVRERYLAHRDSFDIYGAW